MEGLSNALLNHGPVKVFADNFKDCEKYDENLSHPAGSDLKG